jgi:glyoxylase-like metal-dependent hydrolase (beta-lactamase superfamily II)
MEAAMSIAPGVFRLGTSMVNWYLVEEGGRLTVVDAGLPKHAEGLEEALEAIGQGLHDVDALVLTHAHNDHIGVAGFLRDSGIDVHIHRGDAELLGNPGTSKNEASMLPYLRHATAWRLLVHLARGGGLKPPKIDDPVTFGDGEMLDVPGRPLVIHTPGHTEGHCAFFFQSKGALFVGDLLCTWNPLTGRIGPQIMPAAFDLSTDRCLESLSRIENLQADLVLAGHGEPWTDGPAAAVARAREAGRS